MLSLEEFANFLVRLFENERGRRSWERKANPARLKFVEDCIRMVGVWERRNGSEWKHVHGLEKILAAIRSGEQLLIVRDVTADDVKVIAEELKTNASVLGLSFSYNRIGPDGARYISDMLRENSTLLYLDIGGCNQGHSRGCGDALARHISEMLRENSTLLYLDIGRNQIGPAGALDISSGLRENSTLLYLDMRVGAIDSEGTLHISDMLRENSTLLYLEIGANNIGPQGARHISDMLRENSSLLYLNINWNPIGPEGSRHISDKLKENSTLLYLNIWDCKVGDEGTRHISNMLRENSTLLYLNIWGNQIGPEGVQHILDMLRENSTLLYLEMRDCQIGNEGALHLSNVLRENSTLFYLDIGSCQIGNEGVLHLSNVLRENSTLFYLDIRGNKINDQQLEAQINSEIKSRTSSRKSKERSFDECRAFLHEYLNQSTSSSGSSTPSTSFISIPSSSSSSSNTSSSSSTSTIAAPSSSSSSSTTTAVVTPSSSSDHKILLDSSIQEFINYCAGLKKWPEKIIKKLSSLLEEECIFNVGSLLQGWIDSIVSDTNIKPVLKSDMWIVLASLFPAIEYNHLYPSFYAWNPNAALSTPTSSSSSSSSQPTTNPSDPENCFSGVRVGVYTIHSEIHRGPENIVFRIEHERTKVSLALKLYSCVESRNRERDMLGALPSTSGIVPIKGSFDLSSSELKALSLDDKFSPACVFEFGESSLLHAYQSTTIHDQDLKLSWIKEAAKALWFVHENGLIHLDIKPSNFMFFRDGPIFRLKLIDFDCCRHRGDRISEQEYAPGTPMFASPEVLHHNQKKDDVLLIEPSLDVYSFGSFAYYLLSGTPLPVDAARVCLQKGLSQDASMSAVANVMLHFKCKVEDVLKAAVNEKRISEQQASMLRRCLVDRVSMADILRHTFFGVEFAPTYIRDIESKANVGALIQEVGQQLDHHGAMLEDLSLSSSLASSSFLSSG